MACDSAPLGNGLLEPQVDLISERPARCAIGSIPLDTPGCWAIPYQILQHRKTLLKRRFAILAGVSGQLTHGAVNPSQFAPQLRIAFRLLQEPLIEDLRLLQHFLAVAMCKRKIGTIAPWRA